MGVVKEFNTELSRWFNAHGISNIDFVEGEDFCYYQNLYVAQWGAFENASDNQFAQFLYEYGLKEKVDVFIMSLLHEVGHHMTMHHMPQEVWEADTAAKESKEGDGSIDTNYWYWELPIEFAANMWAIEWANTHVEAVKELTKICFSWLEKIFNDEDVLEAIADWEANVEEGNLIPLCLEEDYE